MNLCSERRKPEVVLEGGIVGITGAMNGLTRFQKIVLAGLGACGGAATLYYGFHRDRKHAYASWTTNYSPSYEWDSNWDR